MRKSYKVFIGISLLLFGLWLTVELFYRWAPNNYTEKYQRISEVQDSVRVLITGNSHSLYGLNPAYFDQPAYNQAQVSQTLYFEELVLEKYLKGFKQLDYLILNISYFTLSQQDFTAEDVFRRYYYHAYMDITDSQMTPWDPKRYSLAFTRDLKHTWRLMKTGITNGTLVHCNPDGFGNDYEFQNTTLTDDNFKYVCQKHEDGLLDFTLNLERLQHIHELCQEQHIQLILVSLPVTSRYYQGMSMAKWELMHESLTNFAQKSGAWYINLIQHFEMDEDDFYDFDHLNHRGAQKVSLWVNRFIREQNKNHLALGNKVVSHGYGNLGKLPF